ncbi:Protein-glutamine gamma-glutamyltransferase [Rubripirellula lacrimiformis]|uniref:Protein-glutamine gamma-glutamyltransferase n=1 Tax=Rubripirellula lacrimiformis TaxID=1930273 RepID=A0A517NH60_9BACT|nr:transglutaminase domain-containing protein [Rubripirellula lacrimiformis]QDT06418.1 Protein-glutamine gamma-glutamyltransferase [Rubripirellula lacrimiformis]
MIQKQGDGRPTLWLGAVLWGLAIFLSSTFVDFPAVAGITLVMTVVVIARQFAGTSPSSGDATVHRNRRDQQSGQPGPTRTRWSRSTIWILAFLGVLVITCGTAAWRTGGRIVEGANLVSIAVDVLAHASFLIALAIWTIRPRRGHLAMLPLGMTTVLLCVAAGGVSRSLPAQTAVGLAVCLGFSIGSQVILSAKHQRGLGRHSSPASLAGRLGATTKRSLQSSQRLAPLMAALVLSLLMIVTSVVVSLTDQFLPGIQDDLRHQLQSSLDSVSDKSFVGGMRYVSGSRLGAVRKHLTDDPQGLALTAYAESSPGYLRGSVFDLYRYGRWYASGNVNFQGGQRSSTLRDVGIHSAGEGTVALKQKSRRPLKRFLISSASPRIDPSPTSDDAPPSDDGSPASSTDKRRTTVEVHNDPLRGNVVFLPLATDWIESNGTELLVSRHGTVRMGVDLAYPYVAGVMSEPPTEFLNDDRREIFLDSPSTVDTVMRSKANELCQGIPSARGKAAAISRYFQEGFEYGLNATNAPSRVDPLAYFMQTEHVAHCEFFASASVLMLRTVGVPSRYVTGYVVDEPSDDDTSKWLARNRDAHAWVEAYDDSTRRWFAVESTPGRAYQTITPERDAARARLNDSAVASGADAYQESWWSSAIGWVFSVRVTDSLLAVFRWVQVPLFVVLVYIWWTRYWRVAGGGADLVDTQSLKKLRKVDRRLRKWSLVRKPHETLYQFADRIMARAGGGEVSDPGPMADAARWYRRYADARYQGAMPPDFEWIKPADPVGS